MSKLAVSAAYLCAFSYNCLDATVAYLINVGHIPLFEIICFRNSIVFMGYLLYLRHRGEADIFLGPLSVRKWIWLRGVASSLGLIMAFLGLRYLSISELAAVYCFAPFATALMCRIFVGEPFALYQVISCLVSFAGVLLIADPFQAWPSDSKLGNPTLPDRSTNDGLPHDIVSKLIGIALVLTCAVILGAESVVMRLIKDQTSSPQINSITSFCPAVLSAVILLATRTKLVYPQGLTQWLLVPGILISGFAAQYTQTYSYARLSGIRALLPAYTSVVNMTVLQWVIYTNHPTPIAFVGMVIVTSAGLFSAIRGVMSEIKDKASEDDVERELMLSPSELLLLSPIGEADGSSDIIGTYRD